MTTIIIFKLRIWRSMYTQFIWRAHSVSMRTEWPLSLFSNSAFDVHIYTVYQWGLNDCYNYFQTTHTFDVYSIKLKNYTHFTYVRSNANDYALLPTVTTDIRVNRLLSSYWRAGGKRNKESQQTFVS